MELNKKQKIGILIIVIAVGQFFFIYFGILSPTIFNINDEDTSTVLNPGGSKQLVIGHSLLHTNRFIVAIGQEFIDVGQPAESGYISLEHQNTGKIWNSSYSIISTSAYKVYLWAVIIWELDVGAYFLRDTNPNSANLDYRILNAGFLRNLDPKVVSGDYMDLNELTAFIISLIGAIAFGLVGIYSIYSKGKVPDYRKVDHTKSSYKLPKRKFKPSKKVKEKEAIIDDFEKKSKPKILKPDKDKWEWD